MPILNIEHVQIAIPVASEDRMNDDKVPISVIKAYRLFALPIHHTGWRAEQPTVHVADKQDTVRDRRKAPGQLLR